MEDKKNLVYLDNTDENSSNLRKHFPCVLFSIYSFNSLAKNDS